MPQQRVYIAIDLKSFYASVECVDRGLDPMVTHLVVADESRTEKTICLAVTPALKAYGVPSRSRLFEVIERVNTVNAHRRLEAPGRRLSGASWNEEELRQSPGLALDFIRAVPRMARYIECSAKVYSVYLRHAAPEDIHVYSIDEVFIDATPYLKARSMTPRQFASAIIQDVFAETGITATAGIGTNLYLCKVALDILAKHAEPDEHGVRMAQLTELGYRRQLWTHRPLTDFWRVGRGYARKLEAHGLYTMGDIARCSIGQHGVCSGEDLLYRLFGVNAELLIDHAWGWESCTMADIKAYKPLSNSVGTGQVLHCPYAFDKARLIAREMADELSLSLVAKGVVTDQVVLSIGYDAESLTPAPGHPAYRGPIVTDFYGRSIPRHAHGSAALPCMTSSTRLITEAVLSLFDRIVDPTLLVRRVNLAAGRVVDEAEAQQTPAFEQLDLFTDYEAEDQRRAEEAARLARERRGQEAVLDIRRRFGSNAILMGMNLEEGATALDRHRQIGGHRA
ncbi:MAG: DNA methylase [Aristaeellaceae bacterium]